VAETEWEAPKGYKISSKAELTELIGDKKIISVVDSIDYLSDDLFELYHPELKDDGPSRVMFHEKISEQGLSYGLWFHYPWNNSLVRFPDNDDYYNLRTFRNRNLITKNEQNILRTKKIAAFGLSVGSNIIDNTTQSGIGNNYLLFDFDRLSPTNLNRIHASMGYVGLFKTTVAGRKMADLDPYIKQQHFINGYNRETDDILRAEKPDIIIEEVDNLDVKARLRIIASELNIPLVMVGDAGDKIVLDIERHDKEDVKHFNGKLSQKEINMLLGGKISAKVQESTLIKLLGIKNLSPRLIESGMVRGTELIGFPQLGTTASIGGAMACVAIRDILLNRKIESGVRAHDIRKTIKSGRPTTFTEDIDTIKRFIKYRNGSDK
jgi:hypothetical protein